MSEISATVKQFPVSVNQQFPGGTLFLLLTDNEFRKLMMELSNTMLGSNTEPKHAVRIIGRNQLSERDEPIWVFSETLQVSSEGVPISNQSPFIGFIELSMVVISCCKSLYSAM